MSLEDVIERLTDDDYVYMGSVKDEIAYLFDPDEEDDLDNANIPTLLPEVTRESRVYKELTQEKFGLSTEEESDESDFGNDRDRYHDHDHTEKEIGRNDPCPCGSRKKYKKCCSR